MHLMFLEYLICARHGAECLHRACLISSSKKTFKGGVVVPILQMKKLRLPEGATQLVKWELGFKPKLSASSLCIESKSARPSRKRPGTKKAHPRFPGFSEQRGRIPMTHFARDPVKCSPASLALARPYSPTNFVPTHLAITSMNSLLCILPEIFVQEQAYSNTSILSSPVGISPHTPFYRGLSLLAVS